MKCLAGMSPSDLNWEECQCLGWDLRSKTMCWWDSQKSKYLVQGICHVEGLALSGGLKIRSLETYVNAPSTGQQDILVCHSLFESLLLEQRNFFPMNISLNQCALVKDFDGMVFFTKQTNIKLHQNWFSKEFLPVSTSAIPSLPSWILLSSWS